ncbi:MAG: zf-HC2 domain-containing protein [Gemmatimonadaceae bacterium]
MNHLDEGTIHAWLDGALSSAESRDIETHVAQCAACSAAVAEARGLVAGASRILNALDDMPANVVPKRAPVAPAAKRQWRAAPWVTGIAAALILAVGVTTFNRDAVVAPRKNSARVADSAAPVASAPLIELSQPDTEAARTQVSTSRVPSRAPAPAAPVPAAPLAVDESRLAQGRDLARAERQRAPAPLADARRDAASNEAVKLDEVVVPAMKSEVTPPGTAASAEAGRLAGCYRIPSAPEERVIVGSAAKIAGRVAGAVRARDRAAAPAPSAAQRTAQYVAPPAPDVVRLDTVQHPLGYVVRAAHSDSTVGSWVRIAGDSARVDLLAAGLFRFSLKDLTACP